MLKRLAHVVAALLLAACAPAAPVKLASPAPIVVAPSPAAAHAVERVGAARAALMGFTPGVWTWQAAGTAGDGTAAGIGVRPSASPTGCAVFVFTGKGVCAGSSGSIACPGPAALHYSATDLAHDALANGVVQRGIFDVSAHPEFADCDFYTVNGVTGDGMTGTTTRTYGALTVQHQGAALFAAQWAAVQAIAATGTPLTQVAFVGESSGGLAVLANIETLATAYPGAPVVVDSWFGEGNAYLPDAFVSTWLADWGAVLPTGCAGCTQAQLFAYAKTLAPLAVARAHGDFTLSYYATGGDPHARCAAASPWNAAPYCTFGLTPLSGHTLPGTPEMMQTLGALGVWTYMSTAAPTSAGIANPAVTGNFGAHVLGLPFVGTPIVQNGCDSVAWQVGFVGSTWAATAGTSYTMPAACARVVQ